MKKDVQPAAVGSENDPYYRTHLQEQVLVKQLETAVAPPNIPQWVDMESAIEESLEKAMLGQASPEAALKEAQRKLEALLARKEGAS